MLTHREDAVLLLVRSGLWRGSAIREGYTRLTGRPISLLEVNQTLSFLLAKGFVVWELCQPAVGGPIQRWSATRMLEDVLGDIRLAQEER